MFKNPLNSGKNMFAGDTKTQIWARDVLPILVERAQDRRTITFSELTKALGLPGGYYNLLMGDVCKHIQTTLAQLERRNDWKGEIPHITSIVLNAKGECSPNMCAALTGDSHRQPSAKQLQSQLDWSFDYKKWDSVLTALSLSNAQIKKTILLVSDEAMPNDYHDEVPDRLLSLFTSPVIRKDDIAYPDFVGESVPIEKIGAFSDPIPRCTAFAFQADWKDVNVELEIAYVKMNDKTERTVSLIGLYSEHSREYPPEINSLFHETFWKELPAMTHESFRFYIENLGMYVTMLAIPDLGDKYNTKIGLSTSNFKEWCPIMDSQLAKL